MHVYLCRVYVTGIIGLRDISPCRGFLEPSHGGTREGENKDYSLQTFLQDPANS